MALSENLVKRLMHAVTDQTLGRELVDAINLSTQVNAQVVAQGPILIPAAIVATSVSQTVDFAALAVSDRVLMIPATAGNADLITVAVAGNLGQAAVIGNIYVVLRAYTAATPVASTVVL